MCESYCAIGAFPAYSELGNPYNFKFKGTSAYTGCSIWNLAKQKVQHVPLFLLPDTLPFRFVLGKECTFCGIPYGTPCMLRKVLKLYSL